MVWKVSPNYLNQTLSSPNVSEDTNVTLLTKGISVFNMSSSFFKILIFGVFRGQKVKKDLKLQISVCFTLYLRNCRSYHQDFDNYICRVFFFILFLKMQHKYWNYFVFYWPTLTVFFITICFSSSSINGKKKFWGVPTFFTCVWLFMDSEI